MPRKLQDSVVVITGASSGIGRASALEFARKGATVVLAARREQALQELASECERLGGRALVVPTDVSDEGAVHALARRALENFGRIDVWVNNAAVSLFGRFEETPPEDYRRVIEVNLFGQIYGARAVMPIFREQGSGVLIDLSSVVATVAQPYTSAYVISKAGTRMLSMSLRQELSLDGNHDIHVCTVLPATIDTPLFQHAGNYTGRAVKPMPPVYSAERVAKTIVGLAQRPKREVYVGNAGRMFAVIRTIAPGMAERMMARQVDQTHLYQDKRAEPTSGNLFEPMPQYANASGGWAASGVQQDEAAPQRRGMAFTGLAVAVPALLGWRWYRQRRAARQGLFTRLASTRVRGDGRAFGTGFRSRSVSVPTFGDVRFSKKDGFLRRLTNRVSR